jgi:hypothetical protein
MAKLGKHISDLKNLENSKKWKKSKNSAMLPLMTGGNLSHK